MLDNFNCDDCTVTNDTLEDDFVRNKIEFINKFKQASNAANSTIDDNSNVFNKNIAVINV